MPRSSADTNRLWAGIVVAALVVVALLIFDPFGGPATSPDPMQADTDVPFVAILAEDEVVEPPTSPDADYDIESETESEPAADEVLGTVERPGTVVAETDPADPRPTADERGLRTEAGD